jgi:hypothetical protein
VTRQPQIVDAPPRVVLRLDAEARRLVESRLRGAPNAPAFSFDLGVWLAEKKKLKAKR